MKKFFKKVVKAFENPLVFFPGVFVILSCIIGAILWLVRCI